MTEQEKMHQTVLYLPNDPAIVEEQTRCLEKLYDYNQTRPGEGEKRAALLKEMFAEIGEGCYIEPPLHANFGGKFVHFGKNVYANFNLTLVDDTHIYVGGLHHVRPQRHGGHGGASHSAAAAGPGVPVQRGGAHREKLLDRRRGRPSAGRHHRG